MSATRSRSGLSGLDIHAAWAASGVKAWLDGVVNRLAPSDPVLLLRGDGTQAVWQGETQLPDSGAAKTPRFTAIELPEDLLLRRTLVMPSMADADAEAAVVLEVRGNSPFPPEDIASGHSLRELPGGQRRADIVIASRRHISDFIQGRWPVLTESDAPPEVWASGGALPPILIQGYGENRRLRHTATQQGRDLVLLLAACLLAGLAAMTPTLQLRFRALEAAAAFEDVAARTAPLIRKRDEIAALNDKIRALDAAVADRVDPAGVIAYLTQILPDDTHLYSLDIQKGKVIAAGHTVDASALLQKLSSDARLRDVRSPTAVTRVPGAAKEAFTVEFNLDTRRVAAAPSAIQGSAAVQGLPFPMQTPGAPVLQAAQAAAPVVAPASSGAPADAGSKPAPSKAGASPFVVGGSSR